MKYNKPMSQILKEMYSEDVEKAQDKLDKAKKIDALKQQIQKIKDEPTEALDDKDKETIKPIIKQLKKSVTAHDKQAKQLTKDIEDETSQVAVDRLKRDKKAAQLKKDIKGIGEEAVDPQDTGGAEEIDMIMNQVQGMRHFLDGIERMAKDVTNSVTVGAKGGIDRFAGLPELNDNLYNDIFTFCSLNINIICGNV